MGWKSNLQNIGIPVGSAGIGAGIGAGAGFLVAGPVGAATGAAAGGYLGNQLGGLVTNNLNEQKNYELQQENLAYQKDLQRQIFGREDNSVWRRTQDLIRAGLSPTLAAGQGAGAGTAISTTAPQLQNLKTDLNIPAVLGMIKMGQDISMTIEQKKLIQNQALKAGADAALAWHDANYWAGKDQPTNASGLAGQIGQLAAQFLPSGKSISQGLTEKINNFVKEIQDAGIQQRNLDIQKKTKENVQRYKNYNKKPPKA